jgi:hypothetical protein
MWLGWSLGVPLSKLAIFSIQDSFWGSIFLLLLPYKSTKQTITEKSRRYLYVELLIVMQLVAI